MDGRMARVMLFAKDVPALAAFYRDRLGCRVVGQIEAGWTELNAGGCNIALHATKKSHTERGGGCAAKLVFAAEDVEGARQELEAAGVRMGRIQSFEDLRFCDGQDSEGNWFQVSNRGL